MKKIIVLIMTFTCLAPLYGQEESKLETTVVLKPGGAVSNFLKDEGFKLSKRAVKNLGISFKSLSGPGPWQIPKTSLVRIKHSTGVYRKWDSWITMVLVKVIAQTEDTYTIKSIDLQNGDDVATKGVPFLRMTDVDLNSETVDSCSH